MLLTTTAWDDRRQFYRQGPALVEGRHHVLYVAGRPDREIEHPFEYVALSDRQRRWARPTGALNLLPLMLRLRPDVVQLCSLEQLPLGIMLAVTGLCRVVYDCREDMASAMFQHRDHFPVFVRHVLRFVTRTVEALGSLTLDGIVTADPSVKALHARMPEPRKHVFFNTALLKQFPADFAPLDDREYELAVLGSMTPRSGIITVIEALGILKAHGLAPKVLLIGEPDRWIQSAMNDRARKGDVEDQLTITGWLPHNRIASTLARARIGLVPLLDLPKFRRNIACKAFEYMACGMPTICTDLPPQHLFLHSGIALYYEPGRAEQLADRISTLVRDPERCRKMGTAARQEVETRWNGELDQSRLRAFYDDLLAKPRRLSLANWRESSSG